MSTTKGQKSEPILSTRRLGLAGVAAVIGCAACCAIPLVAAAGLGSGAVAALSSSLRPGSELLVGGAAFVLALAGMTVWSRMSASGARSACAVDCKCGKREAATTSL